MSTEEKPDLAVLGQELAKEAVSTHVHSETCGCGKESTATTVTDGQAFKKNLADMQAQEQQPVLTYKDHKSLKRSKYNEEASKFRYAYVLQNRKTGAIVELRAASSFHACNMIGWRPNKVLLMEVIDTEKKENQDAEKNESTTK